MSPRPRRTLKKRATNYNRSIDHAGHRRLSKMWLRRQEVTNRGDSFYTLGDDNEYRHENRHLVAALRSDDLAAGPFLSFLIDDLDDVGMYAICYWQEVEKFRESFSGMQQNDRQEAFEEILKRVCFYISIFEKLMGGGCMLLIILVCSQRARICKSPWNQRIRKRNIRHQDFGMHDFSLATQERLQNICQIFRSLLDTPGEIKIRHSVTITTECVGRTIFV